MHTAPTVVRSQLLIDSAFPDAVADALITSAAASAGEIELNVHTPAFTVVVPIKTPFL